MLRATGLAGILTILCVCAAAAEDGFDATGQLFFSFDLSVTGKKESAPRFGLRFGSSELPEPGDASLDSNYKAFSLQFDTKGNTAVSVGDARYNLEDETGTDSVTMSPSSDLLYPVRGAGSQFDSRSAPQLADDEGDANFRIESVEMAPSESLSSSKALQPILKPATVDVAYRSEPQPSFDDTREWTEAGP